MRRLLIAAFTLFASTLAVRGILAMQEGGAPADPEPETVFCASIEAGIAVGGCYPTGPYPSREAAIAAIQNGEALGEATFLGVYSQYRCDDCPEGQPPCTGAIRGTSDMSGDAIVYSILFSWFVAFCFDPGATFELECLDCGVE